MPNDSPTWIPSWFHSTGHIDVAGDSMAPALADHGGPDEFAPTNARRIPRTRRDWGPPVWITADALIPSSMLTPPPRWDLVDYHFNPPIDGRLYLGARGAGRTTMNARRTDQTIRYIMDELAFDRTLEERVDRVKAGLTRLVNKPMNAVTLDLACGMVSAELGRSGVDVFLSTAPNRAARRHKRPFGGGR